jgi:uncharacterized protein
MYASWYGYKEVVQVLLAAGADVNIKNKYGLTLLKVVLFSGDKEIIQILKDAGVKE